MNIENLKSVITSLADTLRAAGANAAAVDVNRINTALPSTGKEDAFTALETLERELIHERVRLRNCYVSELAKAGTNKDQFDQTFDRLSLDKLMDKDDAHEIATAYIGASRKWRSKAAALQSVREKFNERAYLESKMKHLEEAHRR